MHCRDFSLGIGRPLYDEFVKTGKARFVYRHYAFLSEESVWAAEAAECAADQRGGEERFWHYHDALFDNWAGGFPYVKLTRIAVDLGLNVGAFEDCMKERRHLERVRGDTDFARANGVTSTPFTFVNGKRVQAGSYQDMRDIMNAAFEEATLEGAQ